MSASEGDSKRVTRLGPETKVFGIGLNKTGTSSLKRSWEVLGIGPIPSQRDVARAGIVPRVLEKGDFDSAVRWAGEYRAMEDRPWNVHDMYQRLYAQYPDSLFILTVRDEDDWWRSVYRWITVEKPQVQSRYLLHFRTGAIDRVDFIRAYREYNAEVIAWFESNAPDRLLVLEMGVGDEWKEICGFFGVPIPPVPYPHVNRQQHSDGSTSEAPGARLRVDLNRCSECNARLSNRVSRSPKAESSPGSSDSWRTRVAWRRDEARVRRMIRTAEQRRAQGRGLGDAASSSVGERGGKLGVVTCYFNPAGSARRITNYHRFAEGIERAGVPLLTVELAFRDHAHHLDRPQGDVLRARAESVMWQKERLLNKGIERMLDRGFEKIAWLDADIEFLNADWPERLSECLDENNLCQVLSDALIHRKDDTYPVWSKGLVRHFSETGELHPRSKRKKRSLLRGAVPGATSGFGWAARADVLRKVQLYDKAVIGGGDKLIYYASLAHEEQAIAAIDRWFTSSNPRCERCGHVDSAERWQADYLAWAERWNEAVDGKLGYADNLVRDLFHGAHGNRRYRIRHDVLLRSRFDPRTDVCVSADGCLEWVSDKPSLHEGLQDYFLQRQDG